MWWSEQPTATVGSTNTDAPSRTFNCSAKNSEIMRSVASGK
jgi:hypothetical protein